MPPRQNTGSVPEAEYPDHAGRYVLESRLGAGGMGVVHLATSASGLRLAIKVIHSDYASDPEFRARFRQEVAAARRVSGAFTAPVVDADPEAPRPWMATLFIDGPTLSDRVKRNGPLDEDELIRLGAGLAEGLRDIHRAGVVHRDLKPSNVLLAADGPKVIDFGISRPTDSDLRTETGKLIGTPPFMAPEQFQRPREVGPAADVFAMGAVLVHAATGRGPFDSDSPYVVAYQVVHNAPDMTGVPETLRPLLEQCLSKEPADRPTPDELMDMLRPSSHGIPAYISMERRPTYPAIPATAEIGQQRTARSGSRPTTRSRGRWTVAGVAVVALAAAGIAGERLREDGGASPAVAAPTHSQAAKAFRPWHTSLRPGADKSWVPVCSAVNGAVYCTGPGLAAARIDPLDGHVVWTVKDTTPEEAALEGDYYAPVLSGGLLQVVPPGEDRLKALDPASGAERWAIGLPPEAAVSRYADSILIVTPDGLVRSLDSTTGKQHWTRQLSRKASVWSAANDRNGTLFAVERSADGGATDISSLDPGSGAVLWTKKLSGPMSPVGATGDAMLLFSQNVEDAADAVVRLDADSREARRIPLPAPVEQAQGSVAADTVYVVGYTGALVAVDTGKETQRWRLETSVTQSSLPVVSGDRAYLSAADGRLLAVDATRGALLGQTRPRMGNQSDTRISTLPAPVTLPGKVIASAPDGSVFAEDSRDPAAW